MSEELRFILSGPGLIGRKHAELIASQPGARLAAVVAPDHRANHDFSTAHGAPLFYDMESALASGPLDAAIISSPNAFHHEQTMRCIERGIPVLVEKPLTDSLSTAAALADSAEAYGVPVLVGHHRTYSPLLQAAQDFVSSEAFGAPVSIQGAALFYKPEGYFSAGLWRTRQGGGPILINMIHEIGILRFLFGEIESVTARLSSATRGFEVEDSAAITFAFASGALGTFLLSDVSASSKSWEMTAGENPAYPFFPDEDCYHFAGTMGSLDFPSMRFRTYLGQPERSWWSVFEQRQLEVARHDPLETQLAHFIDVVRGADTPRVSARDGYMNIVVLEAIVEAGRTGRETRVGAIAS